MGLQTFFCPGPERVAVWCIDAVSAEMRIFCNFVSLSKVLNRLYAIEMKDTMKRLFVLTGLFWCMGLLAQGQISEFPYTVDFAGTDASQDQLSDWKRYAHDANGDRVESRQWLISDYPETGRKSPAYKQNWEVEESNPAVFSPEFSLEKNASVVYVVKVSYFVPQGQRLPSGNLYLRVHKCDDSGEPFFGFKKDNFSYYDYKALNISDPEGNVQSCLLGFTEMGPREGSSEYTYVLVSDDLGESGNYRFSFIVVGNDWQDKGEIHIGKMTVERKEGADFAVAQMQSPTAASSSNAQDFRIFVKNVGQEIVNEFSVCYQLNDDEPVKQTFSDMNILPQEVRSVGFSERIDLPEGKSKIRYWVEMAGDINVQNDTSQYYMLETGKGSFPLPYAYDFTSSEVGSGWGSYSDSLELEPSWSFVQRANKYLPYTVTGKRTAAKNNDYLVSPAMTFEKGKVYRIAFEYQAYLSGLEQMGEKSLECAVVPDPSWETVTGMQSPLWLCREFADKNSRKIVFYYEPESTGNGHIVFHNYGPPSDGGLQINALDIAVSDTNRMDFSYDFDTYSGEDPMQQAMAYLDFTDQDGNVAGDGTTTSVWKVLGNRSGFNSDNSAYSEGLAGKADDWMVFKPVYLQQGTQYFLSFYKRMAQQNKNGRLEVFVQQAPPRYYLDFEEQPGYKWEVVVNNASYDTVRKIFSVEKSGRYYLSIRNRTEVSSLIGDDEVKNSYSIYVDNILLSSSQLTSVQAIQAEVPYEARLGRTVSLSTTVKNFSGGSVLADSLMYCFQVEGQSVCRERPVVGLSPQAATVYTFSNRAAFTEEGDQQVRFWVEMKGSVDPVDTLTIDVVKFAPIELPYEDMFSQSSDGQWQTYPSSRSVWKLSRDRMNAHSGEWVYTCGNINQPVSDYLVSPLLNVEAGKTYKVSFAFKRGAVAETDDSISLYYAYNRFDLTGFTNKVAADRNVNDDAYRYFETYVSFPIEGRVFLGIRANLAAGSPALYVDDFFMMDSIEASESQIRLSGLELPSSVSECDTAVGRASVLLSNDGYSHIGTVPLYISYDEGKPTEMPVAADLFRGDSMRCYFELPSFSAGKHSVRLWASLPSEGGRRDDTVAASLTVSASFELPYAEDFEEDKLYATHDGTGNGNVWKSVKDASLAFSGEGCLVYQGDGKEAMATYTTDCFRMDTGVYAFRYHTKVSEEGSDSRVNVRLIQYGVGSVEQSLPVDTVVPGTKYGTFGTQWRVDYAGVYALAFDYVASSSVSCYLDSIGVNVFVETDDSDTLSVESFAHLQKMRLALWPNPAGEEIHVSFEESGFGTDPVYWHLLDMGGRICCTGEFGHAVSETVIPVRNLLPGIYFVRVFGRDGAGVVKFIKR